LKKFSKAAIFVIIILFLVAYAVLIESHYSLKILDFGPKHTVAGEKFNIQPSGKSALWFKTQGKLTKTIILKYEDLSLDTKVNIDKGLVSAFIPNKLYEKEGIFTLYLFDAKDNNSSNKVTFTVK